MRVVLMDKDEVYRSGLRMHLEKEPDMVVTAEVCSLSDSVQMLALKNADVVVVDYETLGQLKWGSLSLCVTGQPAPVVVLGPNDDHVYIRSLLCGVRGYVAKGSDPRKIAAAIRAVYLGLVCGEGSLSRRVQLYGHFVYPRFDSARDGLDMPTGRELEILALAAQGLRNSQIAETLGISLGTVKRHLFNAYAKVYAHSRLEAVALYRRRGWLAATHPDESAKDN